MRRKDIPVPLAFQQLLEDPRTTYRTMRAAWRFLKTRPYPSNMQPSKTRFRNDVRAWTKREAARHA